MMNNAEFRDLMRRKAELDKELKNLNTDLESQTSYKVLRDDVDAKGAQLFTKCGGIEFKKSTDREVHIIFHCQHEGKFLECYNLIIERDAAGIWRPTYINLPNSIKNLSEEMELRKITAVSNLRTFLRDILHRVKAFITRREQFKEAIEYGKSGDRDILVYYSYDTLMACIEVTLSEDVLTSSLQYAKIVLKYAPDQILPNPPLFKFLGGNADDHEDFKMQLKHLNLCPLRQALEIAFGADSANESSRSLSDNSIYSSKS